MEHPRVDARPNLWLLSTNDRYEKKNFWGIATQKKYVSADRNDYINLWVGLTKKIRLGPGKPLRVIHPAHPDPGKSPPGLGGGFEMFEIYKDGMSANYTPSMGTFAATR